MSPSAEDFYNQLAEHYHMIFKDWDEAIQYQGKTLSNLLTSLITKDRKDTSLLDCSCGIGTQSIGLALSGYDVTATDISRAAVERAKQEAFTRDASISFGVSDFRRLNQDIEGAFDIVLSADNSLPHLLNEEDLRLAASQFYQKVKTGGWLLITMRNYDELLKEKPDSTPPKSLNEGNRIVFQLWDWKEDGRTYTLHHFIMNKTQDTWHTKQFSTDYRAILQDELTALLEEAGFHNINWKSPKETGYYQPILLARKP